jgi:predicted RNA methylase
VKSVVRKRTTIYAACLLITTLLAVAFVLRQFNSQPRSTLGHGATESRTEQPVGREQPSTAAESVPSEVAPKIVGWRVVEDLPEEIALFETVFWEPRDTTTLRALLRERPLVRDRSVLEIGTGSGLISLCCLQAGARRVVATDVNAAAIANAAYNADLLDFADRLETRLVPLSDCEAYSVIGPEERFDVIVSNPPWENEKPVSIDQYALYDDRFLLLRSILKDLHAHLNPGGKAYLAYGSVSSVRQTLRVAREFGLSATVLDDRDLDELSEVFLPAMVIEVTVAAPSDNAAEAGETPCSAVDARPV